jgi:hypothetical protein
LYQPCTSFTVLCAKKFMVNQKLPYEPITNQIKADRALLQGCFVFLGNIQLLWSYSNRLFEPPGKCAEWLFHCSLIFALILTQRSFRNFPLDELMNTNRGFHFLYYFLL